MNKIGTPLETSFLTGQAATIFLALLFLAGCSKKSEAKVEFISSTPQSAIYKDERAVKVICLACKAENGATECKGCEAELQLPASVECAFCKGSGACPICKTFERKGDCRFCDGKGKIDDKSCFNCKGSGKCHICKGSQKCDFCSGSGKYSIK